ncbi:MAG: hypothetical protein M3361_15035 [Candidatus Tectomicrobia bacterium]|nr:hypothetical protein [Candidatus Tectomicrobia bacterium]
MAGPQAGAYARQVLQGRRRRIAVRDSSVAHATFVCTRGGHEQAARDRPACHLAFTKNDDEPHPHWR